jgi:hypothetical protein
MTAGHENKIITYTFNTSTAGKRPDVPIIIPNFATPTYAIFTEVLDYNHKFIGVVKLYYDFPLTKYKGFIIAWNGLIDNPNDKNDQGTAVPDGVYFIRIRALKLFGDINNENDYEVWVSPKFKIKRML